MRRENFPYKLRTPPTGYFPVFLLPRLEVPFDSDRLKVMEVAYVASITSAGPCPACRGLFFYRRARTCQAVCQPSWHTLSCATLGVPLLPSLHGTRTRDAGRSLPRQIPFASELIFRRCHCQQRRLQPVSGSRRSTQLAINLSLLPPLPAPPRRTVIFGKVDRSYSTR